MKYLSSYNTNLPLPEISANDLGYTHTRIRSIGNVKIYSDPDKQNHVFAEISLNLKPIKRNPIWGTSHYYVDESGTLEKRKIKIDIIGKGKSKSIKYINRYLQFEFRDPPWDKKKKHHGGGGYQHRKFW
jgi:hypothetical protein